jgi:hypothetical protein
MVVIGSALGDLVEDGAANPILRRERRCRNLDFLQGREKSVVYVVAYRQLDYTAILQVIRIVREIPVDRNRVAGIIGTTAFPIWGSLAMVSAS